MKHEDEKMRRHRREFLKGAGATALGSVAAGCFFPQQQGMKPADVLGRLLDVYDFGGTACFTGPDPLPPTRVYPDMPPATVSVAGVKRAAEDRLDYETIEAAVREAVEAAGGLDEIEKGQRVLIKPNMCGASDGTLDLWRVTTRPEVVRAVVRLVKERGAHVIIGDRSMDDTEKAFETTGMARICKEEGAEPFPFTRAEYVRFFPNQRHWKKGFRMPRIFNEVDHWISVPMLKNHDVTNAEFTCCLKQFVGICMPLDRWQKGDNAFHVNNISEKIAELNLCAKPLMNVVDATTILVKGGPDAGGMSDPPIFDPDRADVHFARPNLILAGKDRVATDSVAVAVLKLHGAEQKVNRAYVEKSVWDQVQIYYSAELGLGQADPKMISIEDFKVERFDEIKANWA
jgi:uncharacterized protein (DUF362 family)